MVGEELVKQLGDIPTSFVVGNCPNLSTWVIDASIQPGWTLYSLVFFYLASSQYMHVDLWLGREDFHQELLYNHHKLLTLNQMLLKRPER